MSHYRYTMSFTTGGLFHTESIRLATLYLDLGDWNGCRNKVVSENLFQTRTLSTRRRVYREISSRVQALMRDELEYLVGSVRQDQAYLLWLAVCRRYRFIADFAVEVLRERYLNLQSDLPYQEFDTFFNRKSEWHPELDEITPTTRGKLRQVLYKMLREADLLTTDNMINAAMPSPMLVELIHCSRRRDLLCFPIFDSDVQGIRG